MVSDSLRCDRSGLYLILQNPGDRLQQPIFEGKYNPSAVVMGIASPIRPELLIAQIFTATAR